MFTGLVETTGTVEGFTPINGGARLTLIIPFGHELSLGDSVAVNGCCLTVDALDGERVSFDLAFPDPPRHQPGKPPAGGAGEPGTRHVRHGPLRRPLRDGACGQYRNYYGPGAVGQDHRLEVRIPDELARYCIDKGSITIDGISLTIANLNGSLLEFWITPHTFGRTNLQRAVSGQPANLEVDMLAKYVEKLFTARENAAG